MDLCSPCTENSNSFFPGRSNIESRFAMDARMYLNECANCVVGNAFDCPEIAKLGCDHDLAGYPVILDRVNAEFRRPHTIAKGDDYCDFMFYRKGTVPDTEHLNK